MWHNAGQAALFIPPGPTVEVDDSAESPAGKRRFRNLVDVSGLLDSLVEVKPRAANEAELLRFHTRDYVDRVKALSGADGGDAGEGAIVGRGSYEIAALAVGGCIAATDAVLSGQVRNAYALVRPPGHHAQSDFGRGYCIFANVALAALHAREQCGLERVAVVDWDVHHGNGTQEAFWEDPAVLTISIHQDGNFPPGSGPIDEIGAGLGLGRNINIPLPAGSGTVAYVAAFERVVVPALRAHRPELILVASGLDASVVDPLGRMLLTSTSYRQLTRILLAAADELCDGRLVMCHEGGYAPAYVPFCGLAIMEELSGIATDVEDPFLPAFEATSYRELEAHQAAVISSAERIVRA